MGGGWKAADSHFSNGCVLVGGFCAVKKRLLAFSQVHEDCILWRLKFSYTDQMAEVSKSVMQFFNSGLNLKKTICSENTDCICDALLVGMLKRLVQGKFRVIV